MQDDNLKNSPLGRSTVYVETYSPELLYPIRRALAREKIGMGEDPLPFGGVDIWNAFEISWLNLRGKPQIALAEFIFPCDSLNIVESKSLKLYLNSFNQTAVDSIETLTRIIEEDLEEAVGAAVGVTLWEPMQLTQRSWDTFSGVCLDELDITTDIYEVDPSFLMVDPEMREETVYTDLFKSNCLATGQPDWGSISIHYQGNGIDHEGLLKYLISFRNHSGFAEHCVEQIFYDITRHCCPRKLSVYARYTRRGGLDINPFRSNFEEAPPNCRLARQ